jgi:hypothetical protein
MNIAGWIAVSCVAIIVGIGIYEYFFKGYPKYRGRI